MESKKLYEKLQEEIESAQWHLLKPHYTRGALYIVDQDLQIAEVALALAEDRAQQVKQWLDEGVLYPPIEDEVKLWDSQDTTLFSFLIVQPYVLIQQGRDNG